jgi:hypothetical protein
LPRRRLPDNTAIVSAKTADDKVSFAQALPKLTTKLMPLEIKLLPPNHLQIALHLPRLPDDKALLPRYLPLARQQFNEKLVPPKTAANTAQHLPRPPDDKAVAAQISASWFSKDKADAADVPKLLPLG